MQRNTFAKATLICPLASRVQARRLSLRQLGGHAVQGCRSGRPGSARRGRSLFAIKVVNEVEEISNVGI